MEVKQQNIKYLKFELEGNYIGYRLITEKSNVKCYSKIKCEGFEVVYSEPFGLHFNIENKLIRKLKLKKLNGDIKPRGVEYNILELLERSTDRDEADFSHLHWYNYCSSGSSGPSYVDENKQENKNRNKYQTNKYNQKIKQYENKGWFRK